MDIVPVTVVELPMFLTAANRLLENDEREELIDYLAYHPKAGVRIPGTGGLRKLRWAARGRGKRGGARVIYFFHDETMPLFLMTLFAKNERVDLSSDDKKSFQSLVKAIFERSPRKDQS